MRTVEVTYTFVLDVEEGETVQDAFAEYLASTNVRHIEPDSVKDLED